MGYLTLDNLIFMLNIICKNFIIIFIKIKIIFVSGMVWIRLNNVNFTKKD